MKSIDHLVFLLILVCSLQFSIHRNKSRPVSLGLLNVRNLAVFLSRPWLGIKESLDRMAKASSMRWYGHVLRKEDENVTVKALKFEVSGSRGQ